MKVLLVVVALMLAGGGAFVVADGSEELDHPPHMAAPVPGVFQFVEFDGLGEAVSFLEAMSAEQVQQFLSAHETANRPRSGGGSRCGGDLACFLACTKAHESDSAGGYQAVSPGGKYRGAYQFDQQTWDSTAASSGRGDLVGADPASVSAGDQDALAASLYAARGNQPWGGRC